jgi:hypothetical protein
MLICGVHTCRRRCHDLGNHSKVLCTSLVAVRCSRGHDLVRACHEASKPECEQCIKLDQILVKKIQDDLKEKRRREKEEAEHRAELAKIDAEIEEEKEMRRKEQERHGLRSEIAALEMRRREQERQERRNALIQRIAQLAETRASQCPEGSAVRSSTVVANKPSSSGAPAQELGNHASHTPTPQASVASISALLGPPESGWAAREPGVSDAVWANLQSAIRALAEREQREKEATIDARRKLVKKESMVRSAEKEAKRLATQVAAAQVAAQKAELAKRQFAAEQKAAGMAKKKEKLAEKLSRELQTTAERKRQEAEAKQKLRGMGVCPVGNYWILLDGGYRCAGGSHFVPQSQLSL